MESETLSVLTDHKRTLAIVGDVNSFYDKWALEMGHAVLDTVCGLAA